MTVPFEYPVPNVTLITGAPGGGIDFAARLLADALAKRIERPVTVRNVPAHTMAEVVAAAPPDGATLLMTGKILWLAPYLGKSVSYDPILDFAPITLAVKSPNILIVNSKLPIASVDDLIAFAKAQPGQVTFTSSGAGSSTYLAGELLRHMAGVDIVHVPSVGNAGAVKAVAAGDVHFMFSGVTAAQPVIKAASVRVLAVASASPSELFPQVATVAQSVPGYESESVLGIFAPVNTPKPLVDHLNAQLLNCLRDPNVRSRLLEVELEAAGSTPAALLRVMKAEMEQLGGMLQHNEWRRDRG